MFYFKDFWFYVNRILSECIRQVKLNVNETFSKLRALSILKEKNVIKRSKVKECSVSDRD